MKKTDYLLKLKNNDIIAIKNRPAISMFKDNLSIGTVLTNSYITPTFHLLKTAKTIRGISDICKSYYNKNLIFVGDGGAGKTSAFLRLYIGAEENINTTCDNLNFIYLFAPDLICDSSTISEYSKIIKDIIDSGDSIHDILLLDGLEEAYLNDSNSASELIKKIVDSKTILWVACRRDFFDHLDSNVMQNFSEIITIEPWSKTDFDCFISLSLKSNPSKINDVMKKIDKVHHGLLSLQNRPLFATMFLFLAEAPEFDNISNEYELIELFLNKWIERESDEKKISFNKDESYKRIRNIALNIYLNNRKSLKYDECLHVFRGLLIISKFKNSGYINSFYHREFMIYFIVNALIDSALNHPDRIVWWFTQTFYDDITNMLKPVLAGLDFQDSKTIYENLFNTYKRTYERTSEIEAEFIELCLPPKESFLKLRDELLYFILKIPNIDFTKFIQYAYKNSTDVMLFLGIAYGMAQIDPNNKYTLEFAKKLVPGSPEDIRNRGWGMCFFGDVNDNGYKYNDDEKKPWNKVRANRLQRLSDNKIKYSTRVLDLPLLYCYYASRDFGDCISIKDYNIIKNTNIGLNQFGRKQQKFMQGKKNMLVSKYREELLLRGLHNFSNLVSSIKRENIKMKNKILLEIDNNLAEQILYHIEQKEKIHDNIKKFWDTIGQKTIEKYTPLLVLPEHKQINKSAFKNKIKNCKSLIISANYVEGVIITRLLMNESNKSKLEAYSIDGQQCQLALINNIPILHVWPADKASFTQYGSFNALSKVLKEFSPKYVFSVGVAFGIDPQNQSLGDVLISKNFIFYDNFNKVSNGKIILSPQDTYNVDVTFISHAHQLENEIPPESVGSFKWFYNTMLTGGTVLSDLEEKKMLIEAARNIGYEVIGGEMETSGIYYACQKINKRKIPFITIKGICDWGAEKNAWNEVINKPYDNNKIKDCVQALACENAFKAMKFILSNLNIE